MNCLYEDIVVIGGLSARLPGCSNLMQVYDKLISHEDLITDGNERWNVDGYDMPTRMGKIPHMDKFDASFFGILPNKVATVDVRLRHLLELTHEAILDAGFNPAELRGQNVGVYVGSSGVEPLNNSIFNSYGPDGFIALNGMVNMLANRVSYAFDFRGPSIVVDTACSSSLVCLQLANDAIISGQCDSAIVAGVNLMCDPKMTSVLNNLTLLSPDGACKSFSEAANGYVRSETVVAIYLCSSRVARRIYARVLHARTNSDGFKEQGITYPSIRSQEELYSEVCCLAGIEPSDVAYIEMHGTGTAVNEVNEVAAVDAIFCSGDTREMKPLLVGSVKSNAGHAEAASGMCGIVKLLLSSSMGTIPANINFDKLNPKIEALEKNRIKVVTENTPWPGDIIAGVTSMGFGGVNTFALLSFKGTHDGLKCAFPPQIPILVLFSGRTAETLKTSLKDIADLRDKRVIALLHCITAGQSLKGCPIRGYTLIGTKERIMSVEEKPGLVKPPAVVFMFSGMGSHVKGMLDIFKEFAVYRASIERSEKYLLDRGYDLRTSTSIGTSESMEDDIIASSVGIICVQIAIVDLLSSVGILPDIFLGYSVGELLCAYVDGHFSHEQIVHVALLRALAIKNTKEMDGAMISVDLTPSEASAICIGNSVYVASIHSKRAVVLSGPEKHVQDLATELRMRGVGIKEMIDSARVPFHTPFMAPAERQFRLGLEAVAGHDETPTERWMQTPCDHASNMSKNVADLVVNMTSVVDFEEKVQLIPDGSLVLEIAPQCNLQSVTRENILSLHHNSTTKVLNMTRHGGGSDNYSTFLSAIGELYKAGLNPDLRKMYQVELPLGPGISPLSHVMKWDHRASWKIPTIQREADRHGGVKYEKSDLIHYFQHHVIDGRTIFPGTGYIVLVWQTLAHLWGRKKESLSVQFEDVRFEGISIVTDTDEFSLRVQVLIENGQFMVLNNSGLLVCKGRFRTEELSDGREIKMSPVAKMAFAHQRRDDQFMNHVSPEHFYQLTHAVGFRFSGPFRSVLGFHPENHSGWVKWEGNWITYLDSLLQVWAFVNTAAKLVTSLPVRIDKIVLKPEELLSFEFRSIHQQPLLSASSVPVQCYEKFRMIQGPGVEIHSPRFSYTAVHLGRQSPRVEQVKFQPYFSEEIIPDVGAAVQALIQIAVSNIASDRVQIVEFVKNIQDSVGLKALQSDEFLPYLKTTHLTIYTEDNDATVVEEDGCLDLNQKNGFVSVNSRKLDEVVMESMQPHDITIFSNQGPIGRFQEYFPFFPANFLIKCSNEAEDNQAMGSFLPVATRRSPCKQMLLYHQRPPGETKKSIMAIEIDTWNLNWVNNLKDAVNSAEKDSGSARIVIYSDIGPHSGVVGLFNCLKAEGLAENVSCFSNYSDDRAPKSSWNFKTPSCELADQLSKCLSLNIFKDGQWGTLLDVKVQFDNLENNFGPVQDLSLTASAGAGKSGVRWTPLPAGYLSKHGEHDVTICCKAINFRDVMLTYGKLVVLNPYDVEANLSYEYSGVVKDDKGTRIFMVVNPPNPRENGSDWQNKVEKFVCEIPESWSLAEACAVPLPYLTALHCLENVARVEAGQSVLVHSGAGGLGLAVITLALSKSCTVYTTVGTEEKREFLKTRFRSLTDKQIFNSRDSMDFEFGIKAATEGQGVDVVINSLSQHSLFASVRLVKPRGTFIEVGKYDLQNNTELGLLTLIDNIKFAVVDLHDITFGEDAELVSALHARLREGVKSGEVVPLPVTVFKQEEFQEALSYLGSGKNIGRCVIQLRPENDLTRPLYTVPQTAFTKAKVYILVGGLSGIGIQVLPWMCDRGARKVLITSRTGVVPGHRRFVIKMLEKRGMDVHITTHDVTCQEGAMACLNYALNLGPIGGIFNFAAVLRDGMFVNQTAENFKVVNECKGYAAAHLDNATRRLALPDLDHFVVISSIISTKGGDGASTYGFANCMMEQVVRKREADGLPGIAVCLGAVESVGILSHAIVNEQKEHFGGTMPQRLASVISNLDIILAKFKAGVFNMYVPQEPTNAADDRAVTEHKVVLEFAKAFGLKSFDEVDHEKTFGEMGMDSLLESELRGLMRKYNLIGMSKKNKLRDLTLKDIQKIHSNQVSESISSSESIADEEWLSIQNRLVFMQKKLQAVPMVDFVKLESSQSIEQNLFLFHPVDGSVSSLRQLASGLSFHVYGLQCTPSLMPLSSVQALAEHYVEKMLSVQPNGPFHLCGYSLGAVLAFQAAFLLEQRGFSVQHLIMLDGSPKSMHSVFNGWASWIRDDRVSSLILCHLHVMGIDVTKKMAEEMSQLETREDKVTRSVEIVMGEVSTMDLTYAELETHIALILDLLTIVLEYVPQGTVLAKTLFVKAAKSEWIFGKELSEGYGLEKVCSALEVLRIDSTHMGLALLPHRHNLPEKINSFLKR